MAAGLPVITTAAAGYEGIIRHRENGFLVPEADPEAIASVLIELADVPALAASVGQAGRRTAEEFTWDRHGRAFVGLLEELRMRPSPIGR
jgi:glycosyltransferase involved in cell wall biosynthesis